jgi:hypothetical protein
MNNPFPANHSWMIRDNAIPGLLDIGDTLTLQPNTISGPPQLYLLKYTGQYSFWNGIAFYPVGISPPTIALQYSWDDGLPAEKQSAAARADFNAATAGLHNSANDPRIARLLGHVPVDDHFAIISLFCFPKAQQNGNDWFAIDSRWSVVAPRQDGTAHGDPP